MKQNLFPLTSLIAFEASLLCILQPLFANGQELMADCGQAGAWALFYRYGSIGVAGVWLTAVWTPAHIRKRLPELMALTLMGVVIWEAAVSLCQLYGSELSNHARYRFTGTFFNPGPLCGFLAMGMPVAVHWIMERVDEETRYKLTRKGKRTIGGLTLLLCLLLLPAGMSRSAWVAAAIGCGAVVMMHRKEACKAWYNNLLRNRKRQAGVCLAVVALAATGWGMFHLKEDSANGRLFMWKIASQAIGEKPWAGYDNEGFAAAYAEAQERYFATGAGTEEEVYVAGTPDNAFNEYLTMGVKHGVPGMAVMLTIGVWGLVCALRLRAYGLAGTLLAVAVFAFSSYPFQLPDFLATVVAVVVTVISCRRHAGERTVCMICLLPLLYAGICQGKLWQERHEAAKEWRNARTLYNMDAYAVTCEDYAPLYERMRWNYNYLFEYGRALHQTGDYTRSDSVLQEAEGLCGDPMILNIQGKNHEAMGEFDRAAACYQRAFHRLPNRLYPLYLEMELYASPACNRLQAAKEVARRIIGIQEKIPSKAVEEMKERAEEVLGMKKEIIKNERVKELKNEKIE